MYQPPLLPGAPILSCQPLSSLCHISIPRVRGFFFFFFRNKLPSSLLAFILFTFYSIGFKLFSTNNSDYFLDTFSHLTYKFPRKAKEGFLLVLLYGFSSSWLSQLAKNLGSKFIPCSYSFFLPFFPSPFLSQACLLPIFQIGTPWIKSVGYR